jgi:hypothetical protein
MKLLDLTLATPADNLACDEALLNWSETGEGGEILRFWEPRLPGQRHPDISSLFRWRNGSAGAGLPELCANTEHRRTPSSRQYLERE